jgi:hypothetical protein
MLSLREYLFGRRAPKAETGRILALPAYQVAFWPDGWQIGAHGEVLFEDTHETAEAKRWYCVADRNRSLDEAGRIMALHGVYVPRAIVDMVGRTFVSVLVAAVAVQLVAGDWIRQRRGSLLARAEESVLAATLGWRGSCYRPGLCVDDVELLLKDLLSLCAEEEAIPNARYKITVQEDNGFGVLAFRCFVEVCFDSYERHRMRPFAPSASGRCGTNRRGHFRPSLQ